MPRDYDFDVFGPDSGRYGPQGSQTVYNTGGLGGIVVILSALFAAVIVTALIRSEYAAATAIIAGGAYFGLITLAALLILSGSLTQIVTNGQEQRTLRAYHVLQLERPALLTPSVDPLRLPSTPSAEAAPPLGGATFVPAEDMTTRRDAALWAVSLYGPDGQADPAKVSLKGGTEPPGRLKVAAPGSAAKEYLLAKRVLQKIDHGYRLNLGRYPDAQTLRDILND